MVTCSNTDRIKLILEFYSMQYRNIDPEVSLKIVVGKGKVQSPIAEIQIKIPIVNQSFFDLFYKGSIRSTFDTCSNLKLNKT